MRVIGTAGHVDHGKSTLVKVLTGINPDRLAEEQAREMTIDLGFAWLTLPNGEEVGIVDVPGHRDFIENMLAGVGGIDAALFVIAADEGVMPQTREHLDILDILQIQGGLIALTKVDMAEDTEWLDLVEEEIRKVLAGTVMAEAPIVRVSARKGTGLDDLRAALKKCLDERLPRPDLGRPRLPIDRVFTIAGFGTVATGTLSDGHLKVGDEVELLPSGLKGRVRGLQSHKRKEERAEPGSRTAVNITGIDMEHVRRGNTLARPGQYRPTRRLDVSFRLLPGASAPLRHNTDVKFFIGTSEVSARLRLLGVDQLAPGETGWLQLEMQEPVIAVRGDRYILRRPSPGETLGGGKVVEPFPTKRHKRFSDEVISQLESLDQGSPDEVLLQALLTLGAVPFRDAAARARLSAQQAPAALKLLVDTSQVMQLETGDPAAQPDLLVAACSNFEQETRKMQAELNRQHRTFPLRRGMPREELKSRLKLPPRLFNAAVRTWTSGGELVENGSTVALPGHKIAFNPQQQASTRALLGEFGRSPFAPPTVKDCRAQVGDEVYNALLELGDLLEVSDEVAFRKGDYDAMLNGVKSIFARQPTLTLAEFRDRFNTSRRYAQAFLEHLDRIGLTVREGDARRLKNG
jgi:selenocysteine-specific elongation factor